MQYLEKPINPFQKMLDRIPLFGDVLRQPLGAIGFVIVLAFVICVIFAPLIAPYDYARQDIPNRMQGPSANILAGHRSPRQGYFFPAGVWITDCLWNSAAFRGNCLDRRDIALA